jgi:aspartokinase-like uncharacterized kinase
MLITKLGGSLLMHPRLAAGLHSYLRSLSPGPIQLVTGGGKLAECLRELDRIHDLGDETCHWLAVRAMGITADLVARLIDTPELRQRVQVPPVYPFLRVDDGREGSLPHAWAATSDSIAARMARVVGAERLVLLKSIDIPAGTPWEEAARRGWVDGYFPRAVAGAEFEIEVVNFARYLDSLS